MPTITKDVVTLLVGMVKTPSLINSVDVTSISMDSRRVEQGALFIATATAYEQRAHHIEQAVLMSRAYRWIVAE